MDPRRIDGRATYQHTKIERALSYVTDFRFAIDVGAHVGYFTAIAGTIAKTVSFEPDPTNFAALSRNSKGRCIQAAVGATTGETEFFTNLDNDGGNSLWNPATHPFNERTAAAKLVPQKVPMVRLDDYADLRPSVIKIDTEGAEVEVLKGATEVLRQSQLRLVVAELNHHGLKQMKSGAHQLLNLMTHNGFRLENAITLETNNLFFSR